MTKRTRKPKATPPPKPAVPEYTPNRALPVNLVHGDSQREHARKVAAQITSPELAAARIVNAAEDRGPLAAQIDGAGMLEALRTAQAAVNDGDLSTAEAMLLTQAVGLQSLYVRLIERGLSQEMLPQFETMLRLGLRAQAQSRQALEALGALKHGPAIFAHGRQVNVAAGPQQVNNGATPKAIQHVPVPETRDPDATVYGSVEVTKPML